MKKPRSPLAEFFDRAVSQMVIACGALAIMGSVQVLRLGGPAFAAWLFLCVGAAYVIGGVWSLVARKR